MAYNPDHGFLSDTDNQFLEAVHNQWLRNRLAKIPQNSLIGHLIGKILAFAEERGTSWREVVVAHLPMSVETARGPFGLNAVDERAIEYSTQQSATYVTDMSERMKEGVRDRITAAFAQNQPPAQLAKELFHAYGEANRDWRRIALTEAGCAVTNGYLASLPTGEVVVGDSSVDCCDWCKLHIQNRAFRLLPEAPPLADGLYYTQKDSLEHVWVGKSNIGRSRYQYRVGGIKRGPEEMWHPCIPAHPHCRCRWRRLITSVEEIQPGTNLVVKKQGL